jgi:branched-chain amino acid aminotransferase
MFLIFSVVQYLKSYFNFSNYAPTILPQKLAAQKGYSQILWLLGKEGYVTEVGTMNQFFFWKNEYGDLELVTAPLDGTILPGITRDSILTLAKSWGEFKVSERKYTIHEVIEAVESGRVCFYRK